MKVVVTNKQDPTNKAEYKAINISVQKYINPDLGYDGSPMYVLELAGDPGTFASFKCSEWTIDVS